MSSPGLHSNQWPIAVIVATLFIVAVAWHSESHVYNVDDYHDDANWCVAHDWEYTSDGIGQPVTCLKDGEPVAIPPIAMSLSRNHMEQQ